MRIWVTWMRYWNMSRVWGYNGRIWMMMDFMVNWRGSAMKNWAWSNWMDMPKPF